MLSPHELVVKEPSLGIHGQQSHVIAGRRSRLHRVAEPVTPLY